MVAEEESLQEALPVGLQERKGEREDVRAALAAGQLPKGWQPRPPVPALVRHVPAGGRQRAEEEEEEADEGPTDELGMSAKDYEEKRAWQARHKAERSAAIERMSGAQREKKLKELERLKEEDPEEYKRVIAEEERRQKDMEEQLKRDRKLAAALERKRREDLGLPPEDQDGAGKSKGRRRKSKLSWFSWAKAWVKANWLALVLGIILLAYLFFNVLNIPEMLGCRNEDSDEEDSKDE
mmetsp:Transcript_68250/g.211039  ORF Transcript_68250/g.211039 Transcript_68250/m.211039 type:complete len:238 (+) Transcript_68250:132-845(+)